MTTVSDQALRAISEDGSFRVITVRTTELVRDALDAQELSPYEARVFGELLTGAVLIRETMAPSQRVQIVLGGGDVTFVADSRPEGGLTRGLVSRSGDAELVIGPQTVLKVMRTLPRGDLQQSVVEADSAGISHSLMGYLQASEQVLATLVVATVIRDGRVIASGGYIVQLLPECQHAPLAIMTERLMDFAFLDDFLIGHDASGETLMSELLYGFPYAKLADSPVYYGCACSAERAVSAMATLGQAEVQSLIAKGETVEMTCEYCGTVWPVSPGQLAALLTPN